jgi:TPR repeat protein
MSFCKNIKQAGFFLILFVSIYCFANGVNNQGIEQIKTKALNGDVPSMNMLGNIYKSGHTMAAFNKPDYIEAKKWFELAASNKNAAAQFNLGTLYEVGGHGLQKDLKKAMNYYETSYNLGFERSLERLRNICKIPEVECLLK